MSITVNQSLLSFLEKGCFNNDNFEDNKDYLKSVEEVIYNYGMKRYIKELTCKIREKLLESHHISLLDTNLSVGISDGIYLYSEDPDFQLYSFNSQKLEERVLEVKENNESILEKAVSIMSSELNKFEHNKKVFQSELENLIKEERQNGEFQCDYEFFDTSDKENFSSIGSYNPFISATYYPKVSYMRALFLGMNSSIKDGDKRILQDKFYNSEEVREILKRTIEEFKSKFGETTSENVSYLVRTLLRNKYELSSKELNRISFVPANGSVIDYNLKEINNKWNLKFVHIPLDVKIDDIKKIAKFLKVIPFVKEQTKEIQNVLKFFSFSTNENEFNLEKGFLPGNYSLEYLEDLVIRINNDIAESKKILESNVYPESFEFFGYGKSFFFKKNKSFEYAGSLFERIDYRMPCSKKTRSIMYENGKVISANRFFRMLRKSKRNLQK